MKINMTINYKSNEQLWKMESVLNNAGYTLTDNCYWTQLFRNDVGEVVVTRRESNVDVDPIDTLVNYLTNQNEANENEANEGGNTMNEKKEFTAKGLKTNSKKACLNVQRYIMDGFTGENYHIDKPDNFADTACIVYDCFKREKGVDDYYRGKPELDNFTDWCSGLPSIIDTCYYYNRSAIDDLGDILEQGKEYREKYTETQAENMLTWLIYREIKRAVEKKRG